MDIVRNSDGLFLVGAGDRIEFLGRDGVRHIGFVARTYSRSDGEHLVVRQRNMPESHISFADGTNTLLRIL